METEFEIGDEVRFVGDIKSFICSFQPILRRKGIVLRGVIPADYPDRRYRPSPDKVCINWIPKTKRGREESYFHRLNEIEIVKKAEPHVES